MLKIKQFILKTKILRWIPAFLVMAVIFYMSAKTGVESKEQSAGLARMILRLLGLGDETIGVLIRILRKGAHFSLFAALGMSVYFAHYGYRIKKVKTFLICVCFCLCYAVSDEFHQSLVPQRGPLVTDVIIDFSGSLFGSGAAMLIYILTEKFKFSRRHKK